MGVDNKIREIRMQGQETVETMQMANNNLRGQRDKI
jgi:hypothetical protein